MKIRLSRAPPGTPRPDTGGWRAADRQVDDQGPAAHGRGLAREDRSRHVLQAHLEVDALALEIRTLHPPGLVVGLRHIVTGHRPLAGELTDA